MVHSGSWFGLPDFGITEAIQKRIAPSSYTTAQGGSNLSGTFSGQAYQPSGQVLGTTANYSPAPAYSPAPTNTTNPSGSGDSPVPIPGPIDGGGGDNPSQPNGDEILRNSYNDYFGYLDSLMTGLDPQKAAQEQIAQNSFNQSSATLQNQYDTTRSDVESNQTKNLLDLEDSLRTIFRQGNAYLGTRGASDSSAANMYSYALAREGSKQRGDIMGETSRILRNLKGTLDTETKNLQSSLQNKLLEIQQWYGEAQNQVRGMKADAQKQFSTEALNYAMTLAQQAQQAYANQKNVLDTWALNKAQSLPELTKMITQNAANLPRYSGNLFGTPTNSYSNTGFGMTGYGTSDEEKLI